jgi:Protein of unknown function (DUF2946)
MRWPVRQSLLIGIATAMLMIATMAPTLSRLIQHALPETAIMAAACTTPGADHSGSPADDATQGDPCLMCLLQAQGLAPFPQTAPATKLLRLTDEPPSLFLWAPRPMFAWTAAQPRAPPRSA